MLQGFHLVSYSAPWVALARGPELYVAKWEQNALASLRLLSSELEFVRDVAFSFGNALLFAACDDKRVHAFSLSDASEKLPALQLEGNRKVLFVSHQLGQLACADSSGSLFLAQYSNAEGFQGDAASAMGHLSPISALCFASHSLVATACRDGHLRVSHFPQCFDIHSFCLGASNAGMITSMLDSSQPGDALLAAAGASVQHWDVSRDGDARLLSSLEVPQATPLLLDRAGSVVVCGDCSSPALSFLELRAPSGDLAVSSHVSLDAPCWSAAFLGSADACLCAVGASEYVVLVDRASGSQTRIVVPAPPAPAAPAKPVEMAFQMLLGQRARMQESKERLK